MKNISKKKTFTIQAQVDSLVTVEVIAETIEEAFEMAKGFTTRDIMNQPGKFVDEEHRITGVYE